MSIKGNWLYWLLTLPFGLTSLAGLAELLVPQHGATTLAPLGYPSYLIYILGAAKLAGGIAIVFGNRLPVVKEWAYAGYTIEFAGALISHLVKGGPPAIFVLLPLYLAITVASRQVWKRHTEESVAASS